KRLFKQIVLSATYRQTSAASPEIWRADPTNRWFARGPRLRLDAEEIRDAALAASGLLNRRLGGPSVRPYQPPGLWEAISYGRDFTAQRYVQDQGDRLYRRSLYTFWKRSSPPPNLSAFDAPNREFCTLTRSQTNTPQQALVLMNDPTFLEAARVLSAAAMRRHDKVDAQIADAFLRVISREPKSQELQALRELYQSQRGRFQADQAAANELLSIGAAPRSKTPIVSHAALMIVVSAIMNLDEATYAN
ncbi:MAG: DUF1553 domain-containing protein, partial [Blastopirellula sp. JB062]